MTALAAIADPAVFAAALDGLGDGVLVVGGGEVLVANRSAERMSGTVAGDRVPAWGACGGDLPMADASGRRRRATVTVATCPLPGGGDGRLVTIHDRSAEAVREAELVRQGAPERRAVHAEVDGLLRDAPRCWAVARLVTAARYGPGHGRGRGRAS